MAGKLLTLAAMPSPVSTIDISGRIRAEVKIQQAHVCMGTVRFSFYCELLRGLARSRIIPAIKIQSRSTV